MRVNAPVTWNMARKRFALCPTNRCNQAHTRINAAWDANVVRDPRDFRATVISVARYEERRREWDPRHDTAISYARRKDLSIILSERRSIARDWIVSKRSCSKCTTRIQPALALMKRYQFYSDRLGKNGQNCFDICHAVDAHDSGNGRERDGAERNSADGVLEKWSMTVERMFGTEQGEYTWCEFTDQCRILRIVRADSVWQCIIRLMVKLTKYTFVVNAKCIIF